MSPEQSEKIILYTSRWCLQARNVEQFIVEHGIPAEIIRIDNDGSARATLIQINDGYASVPTLIFPDGSKLVEPSMETLRQKLQMEPGPGLKNRTKDILTRMGG
jgi:mycoredoxin